MTWFTSPDEAGARLAEAGYLADAATATTTYLAGALEKPLLVEGPAGVGKTELAKAVARATGADLVRLQCYEGLDEARALYEWNYKKQLLRIQATPGRPAWSETHDDIFTEEFLLTRPLLTAIRRDEPTVLLIDEVDKTDVEVEGLLLEVLSDFQVTIPELGTVAAVRRPLVVLTSNASRELSEALKRRCLYLHLDYPDDEREREIVLSQVPDLEDRVAEQLVATVARLRELELKKAPSIAESVDWARTLIALEIGDLDDKAVDDTLGVVLKHASDHDRAVRELQAAEVSRAGSSTGTSPSSRRCAAPGCRSRWPRTSTRSRRSPRCRGTSARPCGTRTPPRWSRSRASGRPSTRCSTCTSRGWSARGRGRRRATPDDERPVRDNAEALADFREQLLAALADGDEEPLARLAVEMVGRFGAMPGRGPGLSSWSAYTALQRVAPTQLVDQIVAALLAEGRTEEEAARVAGRRVGAFTRQVEDDARRRIAEEKGPDHVADVAVRPSIDRLDFTAARKADLEEMRREIYPLARRLATRLTKEHHARRRGPLDFRRTVRASISTGGVPLVTHHQPKRPHRTELVVLCDVSGSVANFAQFTLLLVFALRDQFQKVRAFTFIDHVHEVTHHFTAGRRRGRRDGRPRRVDVARRAVGAHQLRPGVHQVHRGARRRARPEVVAAHPRRRPLQLQRPRPGPAPGDGRRGPALLVAQPRAPPALGHRRLGRGHVRRDRADGRVPQPHPARRVRPRPRLSRRSGQVAEGPQPVQLGRQLGVVPSPPRRRHGRRRRTPRRRWRRGRRRRSSCGCCRRR